MFKSSAIIKLDCDIFSPLSSSLFMRAVQSTRALEVLMNEGGGEGERCEVDGDGRGGDEEWEVLPVWWRTCPLLAPS